MNALKGFLYTLSRHFFLWLQSIKKLLFWNLLQRMDTEAKANRWYKIEERKKTTLAQQAFFLSLSVSWNILFPSFLPSFLNFCTIFSFFAHFFISYFLSFLRSFFLFSFFSFFPFFPSSCFPSVFFHSCIVKK